MDAAHSARPSSAARPTVLFGVVAALAVGLAIAWVDTRPTWDDTGITAGAVVIGSGLAAVAGLRWWLSALCVAGPLAVALAMQGGGAALVVLILGVVGGLGGSAVRRLFFS